MKVILAEYLGFCYGVKRAIGLARDNARADGRAATLGPIIHNPQMVSRLESEGVGTVESPAEMSRGDTIIIRSHGVGPDVYEEVKQLGLQVVDATCPHVKQAQMAAHRLVSEGYNVVIIGEKQHPEVKSIFEWSGSKAIVIDSEEEAAELMPCAHLGIVSQTTFSGEKFNQIVGVLLSKSNDVHILRTICTATDQRQTAAIKLAAEVDLMLVIGGKNSANTTRLAQLCAEKCSTYHIETASELRSEWFDGIENIGITAGASTPDWVIKEVYEKCKKK